MADKYDGPQGSSLSMGNINDGHGKISEKGVSELDWFTFETKIRKVIADLMEPNVKRINKLEAILYENKGEAVVFKQFFESIANVQADEKKIEMAFDQKLSITNERINQTNARLDEFKEDLVKYEKQFQLLREDQTNVRDELIKYKEKVLEKINEINDNFLQESTKLRLLCSANSEYSKKNKHDIQEISSRIKDLEYVSNEHTHKIYDINDLARRNMNEKLDIQRFNLIQDEINSKIEYNRKSIKDLAVHYAPLNLIKYKECKNKLAMNLVIFISNIIILNKIKFYISLNVI